MRNHIENQIFFLKNQKIKKINKQQQKTQKKKNSPCASYAKSIGLGNNFSCGG